VLLVAPCDGGEVDAPELATTAALYAAAAEAAAADEVEPGARGRTGGFCGGRLADPAVAAVSGVWGEDEFGRESAREGERRGRPSGSPDELDERRAERAVERRGRRRRQSAVDPF
jgi:hypothetical protein